MIDLDGTEKVLADLMRTLQNEIDALDLKIRGLDVDACNIKKKRATLRGLRAGKVAVRDVLAQHATSRAPR